MPSTTPNIANVHVRDLTGMVKKDPGKVKRGVMIRAVLTDFGLSRILETSGFTTTIMKTPGTLRYMARELIVPMTIESTPKVTEESDIWSVAMTSLEVCL
ncbi:hypothetical protein M405DRAFT_104901 [Rhizopogon salebrosus TDB-379]|nr:hypothetical protein M405DRAFT_104901 [Rhizopogon salebrosus TDB-379]